MSKEEQKIDQTEITEANLERQPDDLESAEKEFSMTEILEETKNIADQIELSVDNALDILSRGKQKGILRRALENLRNAFRKKLDEEAALEDIKSLRDRLVEFYSNQDIDFSAEELDANAEIMTQLDRIEEKLEELRQGASKEDDTEDRESLEENIYEHSERKVTEEIDEEFDLRELGAARDELFEELMKNESEFKKAQKDGDEELQKKLLEEYDELTVVYNEVKELILTMERIRKLIIKAETIKRVYEETGDAATTKDELTEILHEIDMLDGEADFQVPDSIEDALAEQARAVEGLKDALKKLMEKTEDYFDEVEIELGEDEDMEYEEVAVEGEEGAEAEKTELDTAREEYLKALEQRMGVLSAKRIMGVFGYKKGEQVKFEEIKKRYEDALRQEQKAKLEEKKQELREALENEGEIPEHLFEEYLELLNAEEAKLDKFATSEEKTKFQKFQQFWRKTARARMAIGIGTVAVAGAAAIPALGLAAAGAFFGTAGFMAARGIMSGGGTYMAAEAAMDIGSKKLGQRGIIDDETKIGAGRSIKEIIANLPFRKGKGLYESQKEIDRVVEDAENGDNVFEKYTLDQLRAELTRLRALSIDKGVELGQAGRLGAMHSELIKLVRKTYHEKLRQQLQAPRETEEELESHEDRDIRLRDNTTEQIVSGVLNFDDLEKATDDREILARLQGVEKIVDSEGREYSVEEIMELAGKAVDEGIEDVSIEDVPDIGGLRGALRRIREDYDRSQPESEPEVDSESESESVVEEISPEEKYDLLLEMVDRETESANEELVDQVDIDRKKKATRHAIAGVLGVTSGVMVGTGTAGRLIRQGIDKIQGAEEVVAPEGPSTIDKFFSKLGHKIKEVVTPGDSTSVDSADHTSSDGSILDKARDIQGRVEDFVDDNLSPDDATDSASAGDPDALQHQAETGEVLDEQTPKPGIQDPKTPDSEPSATTGKTAEPTIKPAVAETTTGVSSEKVDNLTFSDVIDSEEVEGSDSIWRSTRTIFENNAEELGYQGDPSDTDAVSEWAETQTANVYNEFNEANGGNAADLVHNNDVVKIEVVDGKPHLSFENSSGIEAGHLSDSNVSKLMDGQKFGEGVEHSTHIDANTGDQYMEIESGDEVYKIYDWDRDGNPNVVMPDGAQTEMTPAQLEEFLADKEIITQDVAETTPDAGTATDSNEVFSDSAFQSVLESNDSSSIEEYLHDYMSSKDWSESKIAVFLTSLRDNTGAIHNDLGGFNNGVVEFTNDSLDGLMDQWETHALIENFDDLKNIDSENWTAIKLNESEYAFVQKGHTGVYPFRSDYYQVDTDGNLSTDGTARLSGDQMQTAFKNGSMEGIKGLDDSVYAAEADTTSEPEVNPDTIKQALDVSDEEPLGTEDAEAGAQGSKLDAETRPEEKTEATLESEPKTESEVLFDNIKISMSDDARAFMNDHGISFENGRLTGVDNLDNNIYDFTNNLEDGEKPYLVHFMTMNNGLQISLVDESGETIGAKWVSPDSGIFDGYGNSPDNLPRGRAGLESSSEPKVAEPETSPTPEANLTPETEVGSNDLAVQALEAYKSDLDFSMDKLETGDIDYLAQVKKAAAEAAILTRENGNEKVSEALSDLVAKIDAQMEVMDKAA